MNSRREKARRIAWIVSEDIRGVTTPGLDSRWNDVRGLVTKPADCFMDALYQWEQSGLREDLEAVKQAGVDLVQAWREADRLYRGSLPEVPAGVAHGIR